MSLEFTYDGAPLAADVAPSTVQLPQRAENGEPSFGAVPVENGSALTGHRPFIVEDDACTQPRLFTGYVTQRDFSRSADDALIVGDDRLTDVTIVDANAIFAFRIISGDDGNRPDETWSARLAWILGSDYMAGLHGGDTTWIDAHSNPMDGADFRGATPSAVFDNLIQRFDGAMNYFAAWNPTTSAVEIAVFGIDDAIGVSTLRISNVESEIDNVTTFAPDMVAKLAREPDQVYSEVVLEYANGSVFRSLAETATTYIRRGATISRPYTGKETTAIAQADEWLRMHSFERDRITCVMKDVPAASVGLVRAGMWMDVNFSHLPGYEADYVTMRVVMCAPVPRSDLGDVYDVGLELVGMAGLDYEDIYAALFSPYAAGDENGYEADGTITVLFYSYGDAPPAGWSPEPTIGDFTFLTVPPPRPGLIYSGIQVDEYIATVDIDFACQTTGVEAWDLTATVSVYVWLNGDVIGSQTIVGTGGPKGWAENFHVLVTGVSVVAGDVVHCSWEYENLASPYMRPVPGAGQDVNHLRVYGAATVFGPITGAVIEPPVAGTGIVGETPTPAPDGSTTLFELADGYVPGSLVIWVDGIHIPDGAYSETDPAAGLFELVWAPDADEAIVVNYRSA